MVTDFQKTRIGQMVKTSRDKNTNLKGPIKITTTITISRTGKTTTKTNLLHHTQT